MAPANGAANLRKGPGARPRVKNPVVPAIPLPYIQRRAQNQAASAAAAASAITQPAPAQTNGDAQATPKGIPAEPAKPESTHTTNSNGAARFEGGAHAAASDSSSAQGIVSSYIASPSPSMSPS